MKYLLVTTALCVSHAAFAQLNPGGALDVRNNLSELAGTANTARHNLGLGTQDVPSFAGLTWQTNNNVSSGLPQILKYNTFMYGNQAANFVGTVNNGTIGVAGTILTVSVMNSGTLAVGDAITGPTVHPVEHIVSFGTGTGGTGTYNVDVSQVSASGTMNAGLPIGTGNPYYIGISDSANLPSSNTVQGGGYGLNVAMGVGGNYFFGSRTAIESSISNTTAFPPGFSGFAAQQGYATSGVGSGGSPGRVSTPGSYWGAIWAGNDFVFLGHSPGWTNIFSREMDIGVDANSNVLAKIGAAIILNANDARRGDVDDAAINVAAQATLSPGWKVGLEFGSPVAFWPFGTDSTIIGATAQDYSSNGSAINPAFYGVDFRAVTFGGAALIVQNAAIDGYGGVNASGITTVGPIVGQNGAITSINIVDGGAYAVSASIPTGVPGLTIQAPAAGTQATAVVTSMGLSQDAGNGVFAIINNGGSGCANGTFTVVGGTAITPATVALTTTGGVVTGGTIVNAGNYSALPANPVTLSGASCGTAPTATLTWGIQTITVTNAGSGYVVMAPPLVFTTSVDYHAADLRAQMTVSAAPLQLGVGGQAPGSPAGLPYIPTMTGLPTGTPASASGFAPIVIDTTDNKICFYNGAWKCAIAM